MNREEIREWWNKNPMTYGKDHGTAHFDEGEFVLGTSEQMQMSDLKFMEWNQPLHGHLPFSSIFDYESYVNKKVLEIGCGLGYMSSIWAMQGSQIFSIDLNEYSVEQTRKRFDRLNLRGKFKVADAQELPYRDNFFDYVFSWGVLHHSPDLNASVVEALRTLKPGARIGLMLYNRFSFMYLYEVLYREGFLNMESQYLTKLQLASRYGDGGRELGNPYTWPVTRKEIRYILDPYCTEIRFRTFGTDLNYIFRHLLPGTSGRLPASVIKPWARRFGWSIWVDAKKRQL